VLGVRRLRPATIERELRNANARTIAFGGGAEMDALRSQLAARGFSTLASDASTDEIAEADTAEEGDNNE
jgi:hypothetical protein